MWLFTDRGYFSAVVHRDDPSLLLVRARAREDLENLRPLLPNLTIIENGGADYRWRIIVPREEWQGVVRTLIEEMNYSNFKSAVEDRQGSERHDLYLSVWAVMLRLQEGVRRRWRQPAGQLALANDFEVESLDFLDDDAVWPTNEIPAPMPFEEEAEPKRRRRRRGRR